MENEVALDLLKEVIRIESVLGNETQVADVLQRELEKVGILVEQIEYSKGRNNLIAILEGNEPGPTLGFSGHMDVVPIGETEWEYAPFKAEIDNGKLYGRGAVDMKSGLIAQVAAIIRLKKENIPLKGKIKLIVTIGEETSGIGSKQLVEEGYVNDLDALVIGEPRNFDIGIAHRGALWPLITTYGKTAHGSMPENGVNAIENLTKILYEFKDKIGNNLKDYSDELVGRSTYSINKFNGGTGTNVVPDKATAEIDIRTIHTQNHENLKQKIENILTRLEKEDSTFKASVEYINDLEPLRTDENDPFVHVVKNAVNSIIEEEKTIIGKGGYTDASNFLQAEKKFPIIICGPGETKYAHQPNEFIVIKDFFNMIKINQKIAEDFLK